MNTSMWSPDWLEPDGLWLRFLEYHPVTSPPTNQRKVTHPADLPPHFAYRNSSLKPIGELRLFWAWATSSPCLALAVNLSLPQTLMFWFIWPHCASGTWTWVLQQCIFSNRNIAIFTTLLGPCLLVVNKFKIKVKI